MAAAYLVPWLNASAATGQRNSMLVAAGDGVTTAYSFNFAGGYISKDDVKAYTFNPVTGITSTVTITSAMWTSDSQITLTSAVPAGQYIVIYRDTPKDVPLVNFVDGAILNEANLDEIAEQAVFVAAEMTDRFNLLNDGSTLAITNAATALSTANTALANSETAVDTANATNATASAAQTAAGNAVSTANAAASTANGIAGTANTALSNANEAVNTANNAAGTANSIAGTAQTALDNANSAVNTANGAATTANNAAAAVQNAVSGKADLTGAEFLDRPTFNNGPGLTPTIPWDSGNLYGAPGNRNAIVDGNSDFWTASSSTLGTTGAYTACTMRIGSAGSGGAGTVTRVDLAGSEPSSAASPAKYVYQHAQTTASTGTVAAGTAPYMQTRIASIRTFSGRSATYQITLRVLSGTLTIPGLLMRQNPGSGGSPSAVVVIDPAVSWVVTTTWQKFSLRVDFPSTTAMTLGTTGNDYLSAGIWLPPGKTFTIQMLQDQLEPCASNAPVVGNPTPFDYRGLDAERIRVTARYRTSYFYATEYSQSSGVGFLRPTTWPEMAAVPAVTGTYGYANTSAGSIPNVYASGCFISFTTTAGPGSVAFSANLICDARL